jgi:hypothetical protein
MFSFIRVCMISWLKQNLLIVVKCLTGKQGRGKESYIGQLGHLFLPFFKNYVQNLLPAGPFSQVFILNLNVFLIHLELKDL